MERIFATNLYQLLCEFAVALERRSEAALAAKLRYACKFASGSTSEFYGEARIAIQSILVDGQGRLTDDEIDDLQRVLDAIDYEFERIGGA